MARRQGYHGAFLHETAGGAKWYGNGAWQHPWYVLNCLCEDGKRRTIRLNQAADTFFSWPGRASIGGKTVRGYVTTVTPPAPFATLRDTSEEVTMFRTYKGG